jgi:hypothetical protein
MGQRRGDNEATLKRHVWIKNPVIGGWQCSCHSLMVTDKLLLELDWITEKADCWLALDILLNVLENGVEDEFRQITSEARNVRLEKWLRKDNGLRLAGQEVSCYFMGRSKDAGK